MPKANEGEQIGWMQNAASGGWGIIGGHKHTQRSASEKFAAQFGCPLDDLGLMPRTYILALGASRTARSARPLLAHRAGPSRFQRPPTPASLPPSNYICRPGLCGNRIIHC